MILTRLLRRLFSSRPLQGDHVFGQLQRTASNAAVKLPALSTPAPDRVPNFFFPILWSTRNNEAVASSARTIADLVNDGHYFGDNLLTWGRNMSMLDDQPFVQAWKTNIESAADQAILWRRYVLACAAYHCVQLGGDFVECGAYTGVGMKTVMDYLGGTDFPRTFWGYDLFEHDDTMLHHAMPEHGAGLYERVRQKFAAYPQVNLLKGTIPDVFAQGCPESIAYMHIDLNQAPAEIAALDHLFDRMVPGGVLILDDYEWAGPYRVQKLAEDVWFDARQYRVMPLPTGQGLVIKR